MTRRIQNVQALRGAAVLLVVLFHLAGMEAEFGGGERLLPGVVSAGRAGVDLFFVISGFIMVAVTAGARPGAAGAGEFLWHRATRIYPVYWFYTALLVGLHALLPRYADPARWAGVSILRSLLLLPQPGAPVIVVGWTMVHEVYFYLVFAALLLAPERLRGALLAAWVAAVAALPALLPGLAALPAARAPVFAVLTHPLTAEFVAGGAIALLARRGVRLPGPAAAGAMAAGAALLVAGYALLAPGAPGTEAWPEGWTRVAVFGAPAALVLAGAVSLEFATGRVLPGWLRAVGDASYSVYLVQVFPILALGRVWSRVQRPGLADNAAAILLAGAAVVAAGFASHRLLERPSLALLRGLRGRR